jgi:Abortive infection alpha
MNEEEAKAVQEVAKATSQGLSTLERAGSYLSKYIGGPLEQASGILEDKLKYYRWERKIRLLERANKFLEERGINQTISPVPLKIAIPLLEAGSIEEDNDIQDIYAHILANAADAGFELQIQRTYIDVLQNLSGLEIEILRKIYSLNFEEIWNEGVYTTNLPEALLTKKPEQENLRPVKDVEIALANMHRLGLINRGSTWGGAEIYSRVTPTLFGKEFVQVCGII